MGLDQKFMFFMDVLFKDEIYACSLHEFLPLKKDRFFLLYAPLSTVATIASKKDVANIRNYLKGQPTDQSVADLVSALLDKSPSEQSLSKRIRKASDFVNISLLLNNVCNFNCSYCYSAAGRSNAEIEAHKLIVALNYFISKKRTDTPRLSLSILGGGEPMLSRGLIETAVNHANKLADKEGFKLWIKIVTNGSILKESDIAFFKENRIELTVSYEILEDIQNLQRKHFSSVMKNIKMLVEHGVSVSINSVITPNNVNRQIEMIEEVIRSFPQIDYLSFEPLMELNEWSAEHIDTSFYDDFIRHFLAAREIAEKNGIELSCSTLRNVDCSVERYCAGEFAVCPDGSITVCPCISSSEMHNYESYVYGHINEKGEVEIDEKKLSQLLLEDVHAYSECKHCFAKWNCGGGCLNTNRLDSTVKKKERCNFVRNFTKRILWERIKSAYESESGKSMMEILNEVKD
jgi:radical SAM protein with 4Fe4S-binding SPASM domain